MARGARGPSHAAYRVLIADDHLLVRAGIRALIESIDGIEVVGEANDGRQAIELAQSLRPDIVLLDINMPGLNGLEAAERLRELLPATRVVILSMYANEAYVRQALKAGAAGYLLKSADAKELHAALAAVGRGEIYLNPAVSRQVVTAFVDGASGAASPLEILTSRQREILQLIAEGRSTKEMAFALRSAPRRSRPTARNSWNGWTSTMCQASSGSRSGPD